MIIKSPKFTTSWLTVIFSIVLLASCTFHNEEDLFADEVCITDDVTYLGFVKPLIDSRCTSCHNSTLASGNVNLENHERLSIYINNGRFLGAINHDPGFSPMPQGGAKLASCDIQKIEQWVEDGFPNN